MSDQKKGLEFINGNNALFAVLGIQHGEVVYHKENGTERLGAVYTRQGLNALVGRTAESHSVDMATEGQAFLIREGERLLPSMSAVVETVKAHQLRPSLHMGGYGFLMCGCGLHGAFTSGFGGESKSLECFGDSLGVAFAAVERGLFTPDVGIELLKQSIEAGLPLQRRSFREVIEKLTARLGVPEAVFGPDGMPTTLEKLYEELKRFGLDIGDRH